MSKPMVKKLIQEDNIEAMSAKMLKLSEEKPKLLEGKVKLLEEDNVESASAKKPNLSEKDDMEAMSVEKLKLLKRIAWRN